MPKTHSSSVPFQGLWVGEELNLYGDGHIIIFHFHNIIIELPDDESANELDTENNYYTGVNQQWTWSFCH